MSIYIQVENIQTDESKRFGPYEVVSPDLQIDEGNGWREGPVRPISDSIDILDDDGEPYSWVEHLPDGDRKYWHNCWIVQSESVFDNVDPYTSDPTMLRISREHNGDWTLDGINVQGQYTEATISYESLEALLEHVEGFIEVAAPGLKDPVTHTHRVSVMWEVEATDEDEACEQVLSDLDKAGVVVYSVKAERVEDG